MDLTNVHQILIERETGVLSDLVHVISEYLNPTFYFEMKPEYGRIDIITTHLPFVRDKPTKQAELVHSALQVAYLGDWWERDRSTVLIAALNSTKLSCIWFQHLDICCRIALPYIEDIECYLYHELHFRLEMDDDSVFQQIIYMGSYENQPVFQIQTI